jgi:integrase
MPLKLEPPREGKTQNWRIRGRYLGVRVDRSAGVADKRLAQKVLREEERRIEDDVKRGRTTNNAGPRLAGAVKRYVEDNGEERFLAPILSLLGDIPLAEITQEMIDDAAIELYPNATPATRNRQVYTPISAVMKKARVKLALDRPTGGRGEERTFVLEPPELERLFAVATEKDPEFSIFLQFLLYTGERLSAASSLEIRNLNLSESRAYIGITKNGKPRAIHLPAPLVAAMSAHPRGYDRTGKVFRFVKCGRLYTWLQTIADEAKVIIPDGVAFHAFRHTYGAYMRRYGKLDTSGLVATGAWLSHDAARRYEHVDVSEAARASDKFPILSTSKKVV